MAIPQAITDMQLTATRTLTRPLAAPALTSTTTGPTTATLNWTAPMPTGVSVIAGYRLKRATTIAGPYTTLYTGLNLTFNDTVASGTVYYTIEAFDQFVTGAISNPLSVLYVGTSQGITLLLADDFQTNPLSASKTDGSKIWNLADDYDNTVTPALAYSTNHARVGSSSCRGQLDFTKNNGTQWALDFGNTSNSAHRNELNTTGLSAWPVTGWDRHIHMLHEYWYGFSYYIPGPSDPLGEAFPVTSWPGYLILFQLHDVAASGANPMFSIELGSPGNNSQPNGTALRTHWIIASSSSQSPTRDPSVPHTAKRYVVGPWGGDAGFWVDCVLRYKPDWNQYTGPPSGGTPCGGIVQFWMSSQTLGEDFLVPLLTSQGQINWPNAGIPAGSGGPSDEAPYSLPAFFYAAWATPGGNPDINAVPPASYPKRMVYYLGWYKQIEVTGNPQAAVDSTNPAYQAVKAPGSRVAAR